MFESTTNQTPQLLASMSSPKHTRSNSSPYFQHTRTFTERSAFEPASRSQASTAPVTASKPLPAKLQRHNRALTESSVPQLPLITTDIRIESTPATLPASVFCASSAINFDLSPPDSPVLSPMREKDQWSFLPNFRPERRPIQRSPSPLRISNWFQGESAPVALGMSSSSSRESPFSGSPPVMMSPTKSVCDPTKSNRSSGFFSSWFSGRTTSTMRIPQDLAADEFVNLDVKSAIQPYGPAGPFSPSSFKNLQQNAEGLLARMQNAYRQNIMSIANIRAEQEAQLEEFEEAQTRAEHLKFQLDTMSSRLTQRDQEVDRLRRELEEERRVHQEEREKNRTIRFVDDDKPFSRQARRSRASLSSNASIPSMLSDGESLPSYASDPPRHDTTVMESYPSDWPQDLRFGLPYPDQKNLVEADRALEQETPLLVAQENTELRVRVSHLEKELDSCLEILKGIGL